MGDAASPPSASSGQAAHQGFSQLAGDHMLVDDDLRRAVPSVLQSLLQSCRCVDRSRSTLRLTIAALDLPTTTRAEPDNAAHRAAAGYRVRREAWAQDAI
jgi:hypothetical protein